MPLLSQQVVSPTERELLCTNKRTHQCKTQVGVSLSRVSVIANIISTKRKQITGMTEAPTSMELIGFP